MSIELTLLTLLYITTPTLISPEAPWQHSLPAVQFRRDPSDPGQQNYRGQN